MKIKLLLLSGLMLFVACIALFPSEKAKSKPFHTNQELAFFNKHMQANQHSRAPIDSDQYFLTVSRCKGCHGYDLEHMANINADSVDVNLFDDWETSMMGLSAVDPFWRAKVSHESLVNPALENEIQTTCTKCHAPMGHYTAIYHGAAHYTINDLQSDSLGLNGVGCGGCHSIGTNGLGSMFSGAIPYDTNNVEYGPFINPYQGPMQLYVGITPTYSEHVGEGKFCSPCHTLQTHVLDLSGVPTGTTFTEQATYHEWVNSNYPSINMTCQRCHMPQLEEPVVIANGNFFLQPRSPFNQHQFVGGNAFMVKLIKENKAQLGIGASDVQFDSTIAETMTMLQQKALKVSVVKDTVANDTAYFSVKLENKAGHKFPSGYPARRAVLQFVVLKENGDTLFASGMYNNTYRVVNEDASFEPHYNIITKPTQAQIYEMVMGDVNGDRTTVLERGAVYLKDNRIPPVGFTTTHYDYDTVKIVGVTNDADFNKVNNVQGSGIDHVHYHIGLNGYVGDIQIRASVYYQSVPPKWLDEMFTFSSAPIDSFRNMYNNADATPILVGTDTLQNVHILTSISSTKALPLISIRPNPTADGKVFVTLSANDILNNIEVMDGLGQRIAVQIKRTGNVLELTLPQQAGFYYVRLTLGTYKPTFKVLRL